MDFGLFSLKRASHDSPAYYPFAPNTGGISMGFARSFSLLKSSLILVAHRAWFVISSGGLWCGTTNMELKFPSADNPQISKAPLFQVCAPDPVPLFI